VTGKSSISFHLSLNPNPTPLLFLHRNVPQCESCIKRGISHLCAFGDERDHLLPKDSSTTPTTAALLSKINKLEAQIHAYKVKNGEITVRKKGKAETRKEQEESDEDDIELDYDDEVGMLGSGNGDDQVIRNPSFQPLPPLSSLNPPHPNNPDSESDSLVESVVSTIGRSQSHWGSLVKPSSAQLKAAATAPESSDIRPMPIKGGGGKPLESLDNFYNLLPSRKISDYLIEHFVAFVHNSIPCLHVPTLRRQYLRTMRRELEGTNEDLNVLSVSSRVSWVCHPVLIKDTIFFFFSFL